MFDCAAHWKGDEAFSSRYVPFSDVKSQKRTGETYSLDEVLFRTLAAHPFGNSRSAAQDSAGLACMQDADLKSERFRRMLKQLCEASVRKSAI